MHILIIGGTGFVGRYLQDSLRRMIPTAELTVCGHNDSPVSLDVTDADAVRSMITATMPTHVINLAGLAAVWKANASPDLTWKVHVGGVLNIARAVMDVVPSCSFVNVGSGMVYGATANSENCLSEESLLRPFDEYSATKAAADMALCALANRGLNCVCMRPFNHTGVGQKSDFVVPAFADQIARIEAGQLEPRLKVGNLQAERDFLDVRDVADAYALVVAKAKDIPPGTILNVASGRPVRIAWVLDQLLQQSAVKISVEQDSSKFRPIDIACIVGNSARARSLLGWQPQHDFRDTLKAILDDRRLEAAAS